MTHETSDDFTPNHDAMDDALNALKGSTAWDDRDSDEDTGDALNVADAAATPATPGKPAATTASTGVESSDPMSHYLTQMATYELLKPEEEVSLTDDMHAGLLRVSAALAQFPPACASLLESFDHWRRYSRRSASLLRNVTRPPIPQDAIDSFEALRKQHAALTRAVARSGVRGRTAVRERKKLTRQFNELLLAWPTVRALGDETRDLLKPTARAEREIRRICVENAGMPAGEFDSRVRAHPPGLEWVEGESAKGKVYTDLLKTHQEQLHSAIDVLKRMESQCGVPLEIMREVRREAAAGWARASRARDRMIQCNLRLVISVARRYGTPGIALADLIQEGNIGLMKAVERFDPSRGFRFSTYATHWIRQSISRYVGNHSRLIRLPTHIADNKRLVRRAQASLTQELGRRPTLSEVSEESGIDLDKIVALDTMNEPVSLDAMVGPDTDMTLLDRVPSEEPGASDTVEHQARRAKARDILDNLDERSRRILQMRFGLDGIEEMTLQDIGRVLQLSREWIRRIEGEAINQCRLEANAAS